MKLIAIHRCVYRILKEAERLEKLEQARREREAAALAEAKAEEERRASKRRENQKKIRDEVRRARAKKQKGLEKTSGKIFLDGDSKHGTDSLM